jgi:uroporphyrin-III C-methyltransferase/precorrin-2 dehydrogenase/sirohydrochlorin ferrochelatase
MEFLPVFLIIKGRKCVVVGGGDIARRKAVMLVEAGGIVDIITGHKPEKFSEFGQHEQITLIEQNFNADHLKGAVLAVAATDDPAVNRAVSKLADDFEIPINVVDQPDLCSFIMPSIVDRSPVLIAISSSGNSPVLTRRIKELNDTLVPARMGELATLLGSYRVQVSQEIPEFGERVSFWERLLASEVPEMVYSGNTTKAKEHIEAALSQKSTGPTPGEVYLVGAAP